MNAQQIFSEHFRLVPDLAALYGRSERTIRRWCESGRLDAVRIGGEWVIVWPPAGTPDGPTLPR